MTNIEATIDNNFLAHMAGAYRAFAHLWHTISFWMLTVMMDKAEAMPLFRAARDLTLVLTGAATVICFSTWAPVLRHLWVLEQVGMLARYAVWYGFAPVALCTAWDANAQETVGHGLFAAALLLGGAYVALC